MFNEKTFADYAPAEDLLHDKIIIVTGAGDGIGRCAALTYARHGATVVLVGRTLQKLETIYDEIESKGYPKPAIFPINLEGAVEHDYQEMHATLDKEFGRVDGLLHNAGELGARTPLANYPLSDWQKLLQVNVTAPWLMTKALMPLLQQSESASIVFTSSSVGRKGRAYWGAYALTKAACENLVQTWADELDSTSNLRINSINPGATNTNMRKRAYPGENPNTIASPEDIMKPYLFLMGQDSIGVNGKQIDAQVKLSNKGDVN